MSELNSHIVVCSDLQKAYDLISDDYKDERVKFFVYDDFLLENAKEVVKEAYIAENDTKILVLGAKSFNIYAQNSLLKILEEPPKNVVFILVAQSKNVFLPTIRSRMVIKEIKTEKQKIDIDLNLKKMVLQDIYDFVKSNSKIDKNELKEITEAIVTKAISEEGLGFTSKELSFFEELMRLIQLNTRPNVVLTSLLLAILKRKENENL